MHRTRSLALAAAAALLLPLAAPAAADVVDGDFDDGGGAWWSTPDVTTAVTDGALCADVPAGGDPWAHIVGQGGVDLPAGKWSLTFTTTGDGPVRANVARDYAPYDAYGTLALAPGAATGTHTLTFDVAQDESQAQVAFQLGGHDTAWTFCLDDVSLVPAGTEHLPRTDFADGSDPWWYSRPTGIDTSSGAACVDVPGGVGTYDAILGVNDLELPAGDYVARYTGTGDGPVRAVVGLQVDPYTAYGEASGTTGELAFTLPGPDDGGAETYPQTQMAFQLGGASEAWTFCLETVSLVSGATLPPYEPDTGPRVRVNQVGYLADGPQRATLVTDAVDAVAWEVRAGEEVVASGETTPSGADPSSGETVHTIDLGTLPAGTYTLVADGETSHPFDVGTTAYDALRYDALDYFYLARSGTEIDADLVGEEYARPAGHVSSPADGATNQGDLDVPCQPADDPVQPYEEPWTCDYTLDVVGGWYDAGDHGKYVVNGGIATAQLLATYERSLHAATRDAGALADGTLAIPEAANGVPDVLDEARWELEFLRSMTVPAGEPLAGMVHHKVHDKGWTGLPLLPHEDPQTRYLHRPSTAATLNLAATAAQGARLFAAHDADYAEALLADARTAWAAALATPDLYAPAADGADGGGPYDDADVSDEFFWAAVELYLTTGERTFADYVHAHLDDVTDTIGRGGFSWGQVGPLGLIDLATVPNGHPDRDAARDVVLDGADAILAVQQDGPWGAAYAGEEDGTYVWGSNSSVLNAQVVLGTAFDLTGDVAYRDAVIESTDYLLGRNALNLSYVTGYGEVFAENQHSRWFAAQLNPELPHPPAGSVAGGPNSDAPTWDPTMQGLFPDGCAPQTCYVDDITSWASNEITINWNSALTWVASFLADQGQGEVVAPTCEVSYTEHGSWPGGFNAQLWLRSTSGPLDWSELTWSWVGDQRVTRQAWSAGWSQDGETVTATSLPWNARAAKKVTVGFIGDPGSFASPQPEQFWLDGAPCRTVGRTVSR
ncbi:glycoside hydrolase family 9 protein [Cellulosimicrobium sp. Marseille-Q4280]|uniref:glycoside hydrolase family 9 protein n=1 Tax=Cellulosimicrobium sp. Marseille-Q4280 TaxID=2937992 RepID=UPI00203E0F4F|nr:glycoside hydrolase family 9 protein [Cellulosimicrobium sp. Marseille-Q4280]